MLKKKKRGEEEKKSSHPPQGKNQKEKEVIWSLHSGVPLEKDVTARAEPKGALFTPRWGAQRSHGPREAP